MSVLWLFALTCLKKGIWGICQIYPNLSGSFCVIRIEMMWNIWCDRQHCLKPFPKKAIVSPLHCHMETILLKWGLVQFMISRSCQAAFLSLCVPWLKFLLEVFHTDGSTGRLWSRAVSRFLPPEGYLKSLHNLVYLYWGPGVACVSVQQLVHSMTVVYRSKGCACMCLGLYCILYNGCMSALPMSSVIQHFHLRPA